MDLLFHAGNLVGLIVIIAVMWTKLGAIEKAFDKHTDEDAGRFEGARKERHDIREEIGTVSNRVATIEGRLAQ